MKPKVYVENNDPRTVNMYIKRGWEITQEPHTANLISFDGGADVSPFLYEEENTASHCDLTTDMLSLGLWSIATFHDIPCVGICRGGQFLNVTNGGKMIQHYSGHGYDHTLDVLPEEYAPWQNVWVTSSHHQVMIPAPRAKLIAVGETAKAVEIISYTDTDHVPSLCFQPHPEYAHATEEHIDFFFHLIEHELGVSV